MGATKLAIVHFQPLEQYPPILNLMDSVERTSFNCIVLSTAKQSIGWRRPSGNIRIFRAGSQSSSAASRYLCYLFFNLVSFARLLLFRPGIIMYYETYSAFPALLYKKLFPKVRLYIHYHEYTSKEESDRYSAYARWLFNMEKGMLTAAEGISHTNKERLSLFKDDFPGLNTDRLRVLPNYPPRAWYETAKPKKGNSDVLKVVYVGALSLDTMHTRAFAEWVLAQNGKVKWDIYSGNFEEEVSEYIDSLASDHIKLRSAISYYSLPETLKYYDVGVILYNGHIPNFVFNVPNKVLEYYALGLQIWSSKELVSVKDFMNQHKIVGISVIDFNNANDLNTALDSCNHVRKNEKIFCCEDVYSAFTNGIIAS